MMTADLSASDAEGAATAHEVTGLSNDSQHYETVMDLDNNATGRTMTTSGSAASHSSLQTIVNSNASSVNLIILDDFGNSNEVGLIKPSNQ